MKVKHPVTVITLQGKVELKCHLPLHPLHSLLNSHVVQLTVFETVLPNTFMH